MSVNPLQIFLQYLLRLLALVCIYVHPENIVRLDYALLGLHFHDSQTPAP